MPTDEQLEIWNRDAEVRLFFSVDLMGSTAFKNSKPPVAHGYTRGRDSETGSNLVAQWAEPIRSFYTKTFAEMKSNARALSDEIEPMCSDDLGWKDASSQLLSQEIKVWKVAGDEILFEVKLVSPQAATLFMLAFKRTIYNLNKWYSERERRKYLGFPLRVKGSAWIAGFPITNYRFKLGELGLSRFDYIGPSIDCGFRLGKFAKQRKLVLSVDLAWVLVKCVLDAPKELSLHLKYWHNLHPEKGNFGIGYDAPTPLKGVLRERPYPVFWIDTGFHEGIDRIRGSDTIAVNENHLDICSEFINEEEVDEGWLVKPYWIGIEGYDSLPEHHKKIIKAHPVDDPSQHYFEPTEEQLAYEAEHSSRSNEQG